MKPLFFSLGNRLQLMVIPDWDVRIKSHSNLVNTYSIFTDLAMRDPRQSKVKESSLHFERISDPDYFGYLSVYNSMFTYNEDGKKHLSTDEIEQLIELIKD